MLTTHPKIYVVLSNRRNSSYFDFFFSLENRFSRKNKDYLLFHWKKKLYDYKLMIKMIQPESFDWNDVFVARNRLSKRFVTIVTF